MRPAPPLARVGLVVVVSVGISLAVTLPLHRSIGESPFALFYCAVAVSAAFGGIPGGVASGLLSAALIAYFLLSPTLSLSISRPLDVLSLIAFLIAAALVTGVAEWMRRTRFDAEYHAAHVTRQAAELTLQGEEMQALAMELENANAELETTVEDANDARNAAVASEERMRLLDEASRILASSLDYETTIASAARLAVPEFADWCAVDLLVNGQIKQLALAHIDPEKVRWARELNARYRPDPDASNGVPAVIRTGEAQLTTNVTDDMLASAALDEEHLAILRQVGISSVLIVPMVARRQTVGAMTFVSSRPERQFGQAELGVARELARRSALAIDNARLYRAAVAANEAKANFLATMSHELRTPLTAIIGYEELLIEEIPGTINDVQRQQLKRIKVSATHLLSLIDEILLFARVEAGRESVRVEPVVAKGVVDDAITFVAPSAPPGAVEITAEPIDASLMLHTDSGKLRQMLVNLLANAIKFTPHGTVTARAFPHGRDVVFEVEDTGIGIAPEHLEHVFDSFWQVEQAATRRAGGSGLGLTVTRRLARLLGGDVTVRSQPGKGSTFRITLPRESSA